jgi:hypothetical protein
MRNVRALALVATIILVITGVFLLDLKVLTHQSQPPDNSWVYQISNNAFGKFSQGCQDGALEVIFSHIGTKLMYFVEFGYRADGGNSPNTKLLSTRGWTGLLLDINNEDPTINLHRETITSSNVVAIFEKYNVPIEVDYVSIDIDSTDAWVFEALASSKFRPRVFTVEYNAHWEVPLAWTVSKNYSPIGSGHCEVYGASLQTLNIIGEDNGYFLVYVESSLDAFFIRKDLLPGFHPIPVSSWAHLTGVNLHGLCEGVKTKRWDHVIEWRTWRIMKSLEEAHRQAMLQKKRHNLGRNTAIMLCSK